MTKAILITTLVLIIVFVGAVMVIRSQPQTTLPGGVVIESTPLPSAGQDIGIDNGIALPDETGAKEYMVNGTEFAFDPAVMEVQVGDRITIIFTNTGTMPHDWVLDEFGVRTAVLDPGESETVEFVAGTAGTYEYYCSVGNHREQGMVGTITVED